jgi:VWFA-related protein
VSADALFSPTAWAKSAPTVRALQDTLDALRAVPEQRKTVFYISVGTPAGALDQVFDQFYRPGRDAQAAVVQSLQATFQEAMWANVNIYAVDPEGLGGYEAYLTSRYASNFPAGTEYVHDTVRATVDYLRVVSDQTGGRAVVNTNDFNAGLDQILNETSDYYLLGYKPAGNLSDRKYRRVQVKVDKPGVTVQARQGYFAVAK